MSPIVYILFNRPESTRRSFECIRRARPEVLYVVADAPREDRPGERELTEQARAITQDVDWDCDVRRLYAPTNMGCGKRISSGVTEALREFETVIVLEDDCITDPSFFPYCEQLLDRYRDDTRIMNISGDHFQTDIRPTRHSYYFSKYPHCWGWATWRRAWEHFSLDIPQWPEVSESGLLHCFCDSQQEVDFWTWTLDQVHQKKIDSWALPWTLCCWLQGGLTALPHVNLVSNIGFEAAGTHTLQKSSFAALETHALGSIHHPPDVFRHAMADRFTDELMYSGPWAHRRRPRGVKRFLPWKRAA